MRSIHTFDTDYGTVRLSDAVADRVKRHAVTWISEREEERARMFSKALADWLSPLYAAGANIERITIRMSQYRKWTCV